MTEINLANRRAFLDMIAVSEGTYGHGDNGYNVLANGDLFQGYRKHPGVIMYFPKLNKYSTAAGRYHLLMRFWTFYKNRLLLADFSPASQDAIALQQIKECRALADIDEGRFEIAVKKCSKIWASLPGAGYGQHENGMEMLKTAYVKAGGTINAA